jgi:beta-galactosidase
MFGRPARNRKSLRAALSAVMCGVALSVTPLTPIRVACIGDSITEGHGILPFVSRGPKSYPSVLGQKLGAGYVVNNYGVSTTTLLKHGNLPYWNQGAFDSSSAWLPNIVIIQLGTNDAKPVNVPHYAEFQADYVALIQHYANLSSHPKVYVNLPPSIYPSSTPGYPTEARLTTDLLPKILAAANLTHATVIDVHAATAGKPALFPDALHPNEAGARLIADAVYVAMTRVLRVDPKMKEVLRRENTALKLPVTPPAH